MLSLKGKKILVTGGFGFIGLHLVKCLLHEGASVTVVCKRILIDREAAEVTRKVTVVIGNIIDEAVLSRALVGVELIYHLAASAPFKDNYSEEKSVDDILIVTRLVKTSSAQGVRKIIFLSGHVVYGIPAQLPISETHNAIPTNLYGASKLSAEIYLKQLCLSYGVDFVIVRASSCYGPGQASKGAIPNFINASLENGILSVPHKGIKRDYVFVEDLVSALKLCSSVKNKIYNIGGGKSYDINEMAETIISLVGAGKTELVGSAELLQDNVLDISVVQKELGFYPKVELVEGLKKNIEWVKQKKSTPAFFVDFDGTVVNPFLRLYAIHKDLCREFGIKACTEEDFVNFKKNGVPDAEFLKNILSTDDTDNYLAKKSALLESSEYLRQDILFSQSISALQQLKEKGLVVLVTRRKNVSNLIQQLEWLGLSGLFDGVLAVGETGGSKAQLIKRYVPIVSTNSVFIGDTEDDIAAGKELGIKTIAVASGMRSIDFLQKLNPDYVVKDISEIFVLRLF